jgi:NADH-quinone oxidoreductase subunit M
VAGSIQHRFHTREISRDLVVLLTSSSSSWDGFLDSSAHGLAWSSRTCWILGRVPRRSFSAFSPAEGQSVELFRAYMVIAAIGTVLAAGYLSVDVPTRVAFGEVKDEFKDKHIHDVHVTEWLAWTPTACSDCCTWCLPGHSMFRYFAAACLPHCLEHKRWY